MFASIAAVLSVLLFVAAAAAIRRHRATRNARALASVPVGTTVHDAARNRAWVDMMTRNGQIAYVPETHTYRETNGFRTVTPPYGSGSTYATA